MAARDGTFVFYPREGVHFSLPGFPNCVLAVADVAGGIGQVKVLGVGAVGSVEYNIMAEIGGIFNLDPTQKASDFCLQLIQDANPYIAQFLQSAKALPPVQKDDPATEENVNTALGQYFSLDPATNQLKFTPL